MQETIINYTIDKGLDEIKAEIANYEIANFEAVILDVKNPDFSASDIPLVLEFFSQKQLVVIGIKTENTELMEFAQFSNLAIFPVQNTEQKEQTIQQNNLIPQKLPSIVRGNVAKNEQIYAKNCDLVILDDLTYKAEAMSDESVSIYGGGYGSVFAGIKNPNAFIFVHFFQLKLVCINGIYKKFDKIPKDLLNKTVVIILENDKLNFKKL